MKAAHMGKGVGGVGGEAGETGSGFKRCEDLKCKGVKVPATLSSSSVPSCL